MEMTNYFILLQIKSAVFVIYVYMFLCSLYVLPCGKDNFLLLKKGFIYFQNRRFKKLICKIKKIRVKEFFNELKNAKPEDHDVEPLEGNSLLFFFIYLEISIH